MALRDEPTLSIKAAIYHLGQPQAVRPEGFRCESACNVIEHPETGQIRIELDEAQRVPVHAAADPAELLAALDETSEQEKALLVQLLEAKRGSFVALGLLIPSNERSQALTRAEMEAGGWFPGLSH